MKKIRPASASAIAITVDDLRASAGGAPGASLGRSNATTGGPRQHVGNPWDFGRGSSEYGGTMRTGEVTSGRGYEVKNTGPLPTGNTATVYGDTSGVKLEHPQPRYGWQQATFLG